MTPGDETASAWRRVLPVAAFAALLARPVLMARWPAPQASVSPAAVAAAVCCAVLVFAAGLLLVVSRRGAAKPGAGLACMTTAGLAAVAFAAWARGGQGDALAATAVAALAAAFATRQLAAGAASRTDDAVAAAVDPAATTSPDLQRWNGFAVAIAVVALALLAGVR